MGVGRLFLTSSFVNSSDRTIWKTMPTLQNEDSASPQFLYIVGGVMTVVSAWIFLAASTDEARGAAALFWLASGLPLLALGIVRSRVLQTRGETLLNVEPLPLVLGQSFTGYIETGNRFDLSKAVIELQAMRDRTTRWRSGNLRRGLTAAADGRQRLQFSGIVPNEELGWPYPQNASWTLRLTSGPLSWVLPAYFPVIVTAPQAAVVASPR